MLAFTRSSCHGRFQKFLSIYFKFRGLSAKGFDTLHALALTMSHKWTCNAIGKISEKAMDEMNSLKNNVFEVLSASSGWPGGSFIAATIAWHQAPQPQPLPGHVT